MTRTAQKIGTASTLTTGALAGAMTLIRLVLVPFWQRSVTTEFKPWFVENAPRLRALMVPLGAAAAVTASANALVTRRRRAVLAAAAAVIGDLHAWNMAESLQPASSDPADVWIGYAFLPGYHGQGYATEAVASLLDWLLARGARRVFANCYLENTASIRLLWRLGFVEHLRYTAEQDEAGKHKASCRMRF